MTPPSEAELHAYVDGLLEPEPRRVVEDWLTAHPERAAELEAWQRDARQLRAALGHFDDAAASPWLDPARLRGRMRARRRTRMAMAAAVALSVLVGGVGGWRMHDAQPDYGPPMADAVQAHRMFAAQDALHPDISSPDLGELQRWLDGQLAAAPRLPDLASAGFHPVGARRLAVEAGPAAMVLYGDGHDGVISFYVRPRAPVPRGERRDGDLVAQYGTGAHYSIAMISRAEGADSTIVRGAIGDSL
jgi:anti-sigma factor RsiW